MLTLHERITAGYDELFSTVIKWPQENEITKICEQFSMKRGIQVLGAIDSTHIQILKPATDARNY